MSNSAGRSARNLKSVRTADRLKTAMDRLEYRRIRAADDFEDVGALRRKAFNARDIYVDRFEGPVIEPLDFQPDTYVFGLYHDGELVSSMRLNMLSSKTKPTPAMGLFAHTLSPLIDQGLVFVDPSRFAIDTEASKVLPALPLLTHRLSTMMTLHKGADYCLCVVKLEHEAYYRRVFGATRLAGPDEPDGLYIKVVLLCISRDNADYVMNRNPLFCYTETEARLLFDAPAKNAMPPLCVLPTARYAFNAAA